MAVSHNLLRSTRQFGFYKLFYDWAANGDRGFRHERNPTQNLIFKDSSGNLVERNVDTLTVSFAGVFGQTRGSGGAVGFTVSSPLTLTYQGLPDNGIAGFGVEFNFWKYVAPFVGVYDPWGSGVLTIEWCLFRGGNTGKQWYFQIGFRYLNPDSNGTGYENECACFTRSGGDLNSPIGSYVNDGHDMINFSLGILTNDDFDGTTNGRVGNQLTGVTIS